MKDINLIFHWFPLLPFTQNTFNFQCYISATCMSTCSFKYVRIMSPCTRETMMEKMETNLTSVM